MQWQRGEFVDGWYNGGILGQEGTLLRETFANQERERRSELGSDVTSETSFARESRTDPTCEWQCGDHGVGGEELPTRDHAIPQRDHVKLKALKRAGFYDLASEVTNSRTNCVLLCRWRHEAQDHRPAQSVMIPTNDALGIMSRSIEQIDPHSDGDQIKQHLDKMMKDLEHIPRAHNLLEYDGYSMYIM